MQSPSKIKKIQIYFKNLSHTEIIKNKTKCQKGGRFYFREFLRSEYSEENMLFWMACEELKSEQQNPQIVEEKARLIYEDYISILSPKEVKYLLVHFLII